MLELNPPILLHGIDWDLLTRLGTAAILGLLLGLDRELRGHAAGMRTHGLICFAASVMTISIIALWYAIGSIQADPLRLYEASGTFVAIVGAGLIVFSRGRLHNLTTAANLWLATVIGIACGAAQWPLVLIASAISVIMLSVLRVVEHKRENRLLNRDGKDER